jgi:hypothetical protein
MFWLWNPSLIAKIDVNNLLMISVLKCLIIEIMYIFASKKIVGFTSTFRAHNVYIIQLITLIWWTIETKWVYINSDDSFDLTHKLEWHMSILTITIITCHLRWLIWFNPQTRVAYVQVINCIIYTLWIFLWHFLKRRKQIE